MHVYEDTVVVEVVDVDSHLPLPEGVTGSLVATSLHRSYPPIIRYDLRDRFAVFGRQRCECGVSSLKLSQFQGRVDEMVKVRSTNVFPRAIGAVLADDLRSNGQYVCVVTSAGKGVVKRTEMTVRVERSDSRVDTAQFEGDLRGKLKGALGVSVGVQIAEPGELAELTRYGDQEGKVRRLLDLRNPSA
jgi:phenylacetate-CoA ligase